MYSPFCVPAKVTKLIGLKRPPFLSPTNLIIFACTQNGELVSFKWILSLEQAWAKWDIFEISGPKGRGVKNEF